jgi:hypothetical protein
MALRGERTFFESFASHERSVLKLGGVSWAEPLRDVGTGERRGRGVARGDCNHVIAPEHVVRGPTELPWLLAHLNRICSLKIEELKGC